MFGLPLKDIIYCGIIAGLLGAFGWYTIHERDIGAQHVVAKMAVVAHRTEVQLHTVTVTAQKEETQNANAYDRAIAHSRRRNLGIECVRNGASPHGGDVPGAPAVAEAGVGKHQADVREAAPYDPSGAALQLAAQADAQVIYLQARVHELEQDMQRQHDATEKHR